MSNNSPFKKKTTASKAPPNPMKAYPQPKSASVSQKKKAGSR